MMGYLTLMVSAYLFATFMQGNICILGAFLVTLSFMFKLLQTVKSRKRLFNPIQSPPNECLKLSALAGIGFCLFTISAESGLAADHFKEEVMTFLSKCSYLVGLFLHLAALYFLRR